MPTDGTRRRRSIAIGVAAFVAAALLAACSNEPEATPVETTAAGPTSTTVVSGRTPAGGPPPGVRIERDAVDAGEASGVVASRRHPGVLWAIRDSGRSAPGRPREALYAYRVEDGRVADVRPGRKLAVIPVRGARNLDWEDLGLDDAGNLWIADIGDNLCKRRSAALIKVREPDPERALAATPLATYRFRWPDPGGTCSGRNAESLFLAGGVPYLVSKATRPAVYRLPRLDPDGTVTLKRVASLARDPRLALEDPTGAALSADRRRLAVINYGTLYVYESSGPQSAGDALVAALVARPPRWSVRLGCQLCLTTSQAEGVAFLVGSHDLELLTETRDAWHVPASAYER